MKNLIKSTAIAWVLVLMHLIPSQAQTSEKGPNLEFVKEFENLGKMYVGDLDLMQRTIEFKNSGNEPLVLTHVRGCCGTRVLDYTRTPVMPGEKGKVDIQFRLAPRAHAVNRTISIVSNDSDGMKVFRLRGEVVEEESDFGSQKGNNTMAPRTN